MYFHYLVVITMTLFSIASGIQAPEKLRVKRASDGLQNIVTYDSKSLMVYGQRIYVFSGEFHPYRLPVPDLWIDILQKIKAMGFSAVSFYIDMAQLEGEKGVYRADGIFALEPFFQSAREAGVYLIARPGPYINAESSGGGYPGWMQRTPGYLRTRDPGYLNDTALYVASVGAAIAKAQITNGGPVILVQAENEYGGSTSNDPWPFPDYYYIQYVEDQYRAAGITVPFISNDSGWPGGTGAPGSGIHNGSEVIGEWDIWGHDVYIMGFDCSQPDNWPAHLWGQGFIDDWVTYQSMISPSTFDAIAEWQGGTFDPWGGEGYESCATLFNMEYHRVFNKNNMAQYVTLMNFYMTYGGTNWGHLGYPPAYTSYDYAATIPENKVLSREKYSENKLQANFMRVSPAYLTAIPQNYSTSVYTNTNAITTTPLFGDGSPTKFFVVRHINYAEGSSTSYKLTLPTSQGNLSIPQFDGTLTLSGRDSKWHVTDYDLAGTNLLYSTAEIFTWKDYGDKKILIVYGGPNEQHELAISDAKSAPKLWEGPATGISYGGSRRAVLSWQTNTTNRRVVQIDDLFIYILDRNSAYSHWVLDLERSDYWGNYSANVGNTTSIVLEAGYLVRHASVDGTSLKLLGDLNATVPIRIMGTPSGLTKLFWNGDELSFTLDTVTREWTSTLSYTQPTVSLPVLQDFGWKYIDNLPELQLSYDDSLWTPATLTSTFNPSRNLTTPTSLYGTDYNYDSGHLLFRGSFTATGNETSFSLTTQGGANYGDSVWLNSTYIGSFIGSPSSDSSRNGSFKSTYSIPSLTAGSKYVFTIIVQNSGFEEEPAVGINSMKQPRGILDYELGGREQSAISWKITGNLHGESYVDKDRGPLNEGGFYAERQGFTQPYPPSENWESGKPIEGIKKAGVAFYTTSFDLDLPEGYDIPLSFVFGKTVINGQTSAYRALLWVNGYLYGSYINHFGPQTVFPVPQGILDYHGTNWVGIELWAQQANGAYLKSLTLEAGVPVMTALKTPANAPMPRYAQREGAY